MNEDYRISEIKQSITKYQDTIHSINNIRMELSRQEMDAWTELAIVLNADNPKALHRFFNDSTR